MIAVFARANHPPGWGYGPVGDEKGSRAHGYVVLFVRCADEAELDAVHRRMTIRDFHGIEGARHYFDGALDPNGHEWFGGRFELIATAPDVSLDAISSGQRFCCRGDNRMVALYDAGEVLGDA